MDSTAKVVTRNATNSHPAAECFDQDMAVIQVRLGAGPDERVLGDMRWRRPDGTGFLSGPSYAAEC